MPLQRRGLSRNRICLPLNTRRDARVCSEIASSNMTSAKSAKIGFAQNTLNHDRRNPISLPTNLILRDQRENLYRTARTQYPIPSTTKESSLSQLLGIGCLQLEKIAIHACHVSTSSTRQEAKRQLPAPYSDPQNRLSLQPCTVPFSRFVFC